MVYVINGEQLLYRKKVTVNGSMVTTETGIPLARNIVLPGVKTGGADVRLAKFDGTPIAREIECVGVPSTDAVMFHYPFDTVAGENSQFYVYWGNPDLIEPAADSTYGSEAVWEPSALGVYLMNNGTTMTDSSGNGRHGTAYGSPSSADLAYSKGIELFGTNEYYILPSSTGLDTYGTVITQFLIKGRTTNHIIYADYQDGDNEKKIFYDTLNIHNTLYDNAAYQMQQDSAFSLNEEIVSSFTYQDNDGYSQIGTQTQTDNTVNMDAYAHNVYLGYYTAGYDKMVGVLGHVRILNERVSNNYLATTHKNLNNPTASGTDPFYLADGIVEHQRRHPIFM